MCSSQLLLMENWPSEGKDESTITSWEASKNPNENGGGLAKARKVGVQTSSCNQIFVHTFTFCEGLNCALTPPNSYVEALTSSTLKCGPIWKEGQCRYN